MNLVRTYQLNEKNKGYQGVALVFLIMPFAQAVGPL